VHDGIRHFVESMIEAELEEGLSRPRYRRRAKAGVEPSEETGPQPSALLSPPVPGGAFGPVEISVPRARLHSAHGKTTERKSRTLPAYQRCPQAADALIARPYLSGTKTRRVHPALATLSAGQ
jgi:putative transposase